MSSVYNVYLCDPNDKDKDIFIAGFTSANLALEFMNDYPLTDCIQRYKIERG